MFLLIIVEACCEQFFYKIFNFLFGEAKNYTRK
jgi:hypothetical protein